MKVRGMLLSINGPLHDVIKINLPRVPNVEDVNMFVRVLRDELSMLPF